MKCRKCGAMLREADVYCAKCGWRVERENGYPRQETLDIPIAAIEQNIIETTEKELGGIARPSGNNYAKMNNRKAYFEEEREEIDYEEIDYEETEDEEYYGDDGEDYEDTEDDYEDEGYDGIEYEDGEYEDEEDGGNRLFTIMIAGMAFLILAIAAFVGFRLIRNAPIKNYGSGQNSIAEEDESDVGEDGGFTDKEAEDIPAGTIVILSNVNVRDNPSTENSQILKVAKEGEYYEYVGMSEDGSWYNVLLEDGSKAYIFKDYAAEE